jgi:biotin-dependent carboxylase-like uncharacterized protein
MPHLTVIRPGMLTTVQDLGRWGYQASGVPVAGPMDAYSHRAANLLLGNREDAAALEITLIGPELEAAGAMTCATAGGEFAVSVNGVAAPHHQPFEVPDGARIRVAARHRGARMTLAVRGGFDLPPVFGSRAQSVIARMGPFDGRPLTAGDVLPIGHNVGVRGSGTPLPLAVPDGGAKLRVVLGPHEARFTPQALDTLLSARFIVTPNSNRMGYRLEGPPLQHSAGADILSDATPVGSLQVPGSGQPILLMADRQTTGGYPKIATVITADLPLAGQLAPGDWIEFVACSRDAAIDALRAQEHRLAGRHA